jgi:hypothetical protein
VIRFIESPFENLQIERGHGTPTFAEHDST